MTRFVDAHSISILVVEDNIADFILLKESIGLTNLNIAKIDLADSLVAAKEYLASEKPDIVFLDLFLPDSNGMNSFGDLKHLLNNSAVIILSGLSDTKTALEAIAQGAQDYLAKGEFDEKILEKTITYAIERRRNLEKLRQANERYTIVTQATHDLIWDWDLVTGEVYRDESGVNKVYGISSIESIININDWYNCIHPSDIQSILEITEEIKNSTQKDFFEIEYRFKTEDGSYKNIFDRGFIVRNPDGIPIRIIGAAQDITEKTKLEKALKQSQRLQQRAITAATIKGQENEREQIGIELHDNINQILATSKLYIDHALTTEVIKKDIILQSKELINLATDEIRKLSHALLPPALDEFGLKPAINDLTESIDRTAGIKFVKNWGNFDETYLERDLKLTLYRIVQEQLNNILKHAKATHITISLSSGKESLELNILDNGIGFDTTTKRKGVGLRNISSRAELFSGNVTILSAPGKGCELITTFPLPLVHMNMAV